MWSSLANIVGEIKKCEAAGATTAALALAFVCIDTMAYLALPVGKEKQGRSDFIEWVDTYLKAHPSQPYQYRGLDVYGARCALLHAYGSEADFHEKYPESKKFGYHDGGKHAYDPHVEERLVLVGTASFLNDLVSGIEEFLKACSADKQLRARVEARLPKVLANFPVTA
jgi:hypothetical protein